MVFIPTSALRANFCFTIGGIYCENQPGRITARESFWYNRYLIQRKSRESVATDPLDLYISAQYPQLSESRVRVEIKCIRGWEVQVEVWSEQKPGGTPYQSNGPVHYVSLDDAIK